MNKIILAAPFGNYIKLPGTIRTKGTFTLNKRSGAIWGALTRIGFSFSGIFNRMGLRNPGIRSQLQFFRKQSENDIIYSITEFNVFDFKQVLSCIPSNRAIEINLSCPNKESELTDEEIKSVVSKAADWFDVVIVKLPANFEKACDLFHLSYGLGIRWFHFCNTIKTPKGGLSGRAIQCYSLPLIRAFKKQYPDIIVIGGGGIYTADDIKRYLEVGADYLSLGTVLFLPWYWPSLAWGILKYLK